MDDKNLEQIRDLLDIGRTDKLLSAAIERAGSLEKGKYGEEDIKKQRIVIGFGNLHIKTAGTKMSAVRLLGYKKSLSDTTQAIRRRFGRRSKNG